MEKPTIAIAKESVTSLGVSTNSGIVGGRSLITHEKIMKENDKEK